METIRNLITNVATYVQNDIEPLLAKKPVYYTTAKYALIASGVGLGLVADVKHLIALILGAVLISIGLNMKQKDTNNKL